MALRYLHFDTSEGDDDSASFDAMASVPAAALPALLAELAQVLGWASRQFPSARGPLDEGFAWDYDLQATQETSRQERLQYDAPSGTLQRCPAPGTAESVRHTVSLTICGTAAFTEAFSARFAPDSD